MMNKNQCLGRNHLTVHHRDCLFNKCLTANAYYVKHALGYQNHPSNQILCISENITIVSQ